MTPKEIYKYALEHNIEDQAIIFQVNVGNTNVELEADYIYCVSSEWHARISLK